MKKEEFLRLRHGTMTILEYKHKFNELSRFDIELVPNEAEKCRQVKEGLWMTIQTMIAVNTYLTMRALT